MNERERNKLLANQTGFFVKKVKIIKNRQNTKWQKKEGCVKKKR
jgi:hypothetical protein